MHNIDSRIQLFCRHRATTSNLLFNLILFCHSYEVSLLATSVSSLGSPDRKKFLAWVERLSVNSWTDRQTSKYEHLPCPQVRVCWTHSLPPGFGIVCYANFHTELLPSGTGTATQVTRYLKPLLHVIYDYASLQLCAG